jgi:hypothetical protein
MLSSTSTGRRARVVSAISLMAAAALALSACGGGSSSSSTTSTGASGATGAAGSTSTTSTGGSVAGTSQFQDQLRQSLQSQGSLTDDQINCVIDKVSSSLSDQDLQDQTQVQQETLDALNSCGINPGTVNP